MIKLKTLSSTTLVNLAAANDRSIGHLCKVATEDPAYLQLMHKAERRRQEINQTNAGKIFALTNQTHVILDILFDRNHKINEPRRPKCRTAKAVTRRATAEHRRSVTVGN